MSNAVSWGKGLLSESKDDLTHEGASIPSNNSPCLRKGVASPSPVSICARSGAGGASQAISRETQWTATCRAVGGQQARTGSRSVY